MCYDLRHIQASAQLLSVSYVAVFLPMAIYRQMLLDQMDVRLANEKTLVHTTVYTRLKKKH